MRVPVMLKLRWEPMSEKWTEIWAYEAPFELAIFSSVFNSQKYPYCVKCFENEICTNLLKANLKFDMTKYVN